MPKQKTTTDLKDEIDKSVKMFDVAKPGATAPDATSRPIIVGHEKKLETDPMMRPDIPETPEETPEPPKPRKEIVIEPVPKDDPELPSPIEVAVEEPNVEVNQAAAVETVAQEITPKRQKQKEEADQAARLEEVQKAIDSRQFNVPISQEHLSSSGSKVVLVVLLLIVIAGISLNFALDAELLETSIEPLTNLL